MVASFLHRYIREHHGIELCPGNFTYGNLLPDFRPAYKKVPHEREYWARYLKNEITRLSDFKQESPCFGVNYSRRLGILCHFYADFFCFAHTPDFEGGSYAHVRYELALHRHIRDIMPALDGVDFGGSTDKRDAGAIQGGFTALQELYLKREPSFDNDIAFTLRACVEAVTAIAGNSVVMKKPSVGQLITEPAKG